MESHDQNFKNIFLDFPEEALDWILPQAKKDWGKIWNIDFPRQETRKYKLTDGHFNLDMPILYYFEKNKVLVWLVEFQEDKEKFSIYKLLHYTTDLMEQFPNTLVIPTVLFTDRKEWNIDVKRKLEMKYKQYLLLHFEYIFIKLFDYNAKDFFHVQNPVIKILLPKMNYEPHERFEVIRQAYSGLFQLASSLLFEKYVYFIDTYSEIKEEEKVIIYNELKNKKDTVMLAQYIKELGLEEGRTSILNHQIAKKYQVDNSNVSILFQGLKQNDLLDLSEKILEWNSFDEVKYWVQQKKQENMKI